MGITRHVGRFLVKHGADIACIVGCVGVPVATIMACRATMKLEAILDESQAIIDEIHERYGEQIESKEGKKELAKAYRKTAGKVAKLYAPAAALEVASIALIGGSHVHIRKENIAVTAAYAALNETYKNYRERVKKELGAQKERDLRFGLEHKEETDIDENGEVQTREYYRFPYDNLGVYAKFFDCGNPNFDPRNFEQNIIFLRSVERQFTNKLHQDGIVYLNEVYQALGFPKTHDGAKICWIDGIGDSCVDFGIYDISDAAKRAFVNGEVDGILLDFNVDGPDDIFWEIEKKKRNRDVARAHAAIAYAYNKQKGIDIKEEEIHE